MMVSSAAREPIRRLHNVVVLSDTAYIDGGGASVALQSAIALARPGLNVTVLSAVGPPMAGLRDVPHLTVLCSDQRHLGSTPLAAARQNVWNDRASAMLESALSTCDPNDTVVHVHGWTKALSSSIFYTARRLGFRVVVTLHDFFSICPNGSLYLHRDRRICTLEPMGARCIATDCDSRNYAVKAYRVARQTVQERIAGMPDTVDRFISVSQFSQAIIEPHLPAGAKIDYVRNPVDRKLEPAASPEEHARFLYVGRFSPEKGVALFARAAAEADVQADFVGDGPCANEIVKLDAGAKLFGWLSAAGVDREIRRSRALVLPSLWYETYGLTVMEAAAAGIPAIVPDTCAARDLVVHGETGLWFEGGSTASLASCLRQLSQPGVAERLGARAYERYWSDPPTMMRHIEELLNVYERMLVTSEERF